MDRSWAEVVIEAEEVGRVLSSQVSEPVVRESVTQPESVEGFTEEVGEEVDEPVLDPVHPELRKVTRVIRKTDVNTSNVVRLEDNVSWTGGRKVEGSGKLRQLVLKANNQRFLTKLKLDGKVYIDDYWAGLNSITTELDSVAAYQTGSNYVVSVSDVYFRESLETAVRPVGTITFPLMFLEVELFDE